MNNHQMMLAAMALLWIGHVLYGIESEILRLEAAVQRLLGELPPLR